MSSIGDPFLRAKTPMGVVIDPLKLDDLASADRTGDLGSVYLSISLGPIRYFEGDGLDKFAKSDVDRRML